MVERGETMELRLEARQLFLLDAACDAANSYYLRIHHGKDDLATDPVELRAAAIQGVIMLFQMLGLPQDRMQLRPLLDLKQNHYIGQLVKRVARQREEAEAERRRASQRKESERRAAEAAAAAEAREAARKRRRLSVGAMAVLLMAGLAGAIAVAHHDDVAPPHNRPPPQEKEDDNLH